MLTATVKISPNMVRNAASDVIELWVMAGDGYGGDAVKLCGLDRDQMVKDLADWPVFQKALTDYVVDFGLNGIHHDFDELFLNNFDGAAPILREFERNLYPVLNWLQDIIDDAHRVDHSDDCDEAIAVLKRAGYKVVKTR